MKKYDNASENYILLPVSQTRFTKKNKPKVADFFVKPKILNSHISLKVLDSIDLEGAKLIRINNNELADFRFSYPGFRIIPEKFYRPAVCTKEKVRLWPKQMRTTVAVSVTITDDRGKGIEGVSVVVFTDFAAGQGASVLTDQHGLARLKLSSTIAERIYVYADHSYWGYFRNNVKLNNQLKIKLKSIKPGYKDALRYFYDTANWPPLAHQVKVGIIDTGVGPHPDLEVSGGKNLVRGENEADYNDNGEGHGTHVAGIIAANGSFKGVATGVKLMSYRVFPKGEGASNFDIMKAIDQAIKDKCDLINMSLGEAHDDEAISSYIKEAYHAGILCFAANGNDNRDAVNFPAAYSLSIAVSAMGRKGTFPASSVETGSIAAPYGTDKKNFIADFSNIGTETDLTAPGVGIISTYLDEKYAVMDGTSMACPVATGIAARILAGHPDVLNLSRNRVRADEIVKLLAVNIKLMGFGATFEGKGMLYDKDELHSKI